MVGLIAAGICALLILALFRLNRESEARISGALWIPFCWLFISASRSVSQWIGYSGGGMSDQYLDGSPLDRAVLTAILALGVIVLIGRSRRVWQLLQSNIPILLFFLYCGTSALWSDFPDVSIKRWFRALGDVVMVLIVLSDRDWRTAFSQLLARLGFVLVPVSVLFIRYFPNLGRTYSRGGGATWTGVATEKNALGMICMICGLAAVYRFIEVYRGEEGATKRRVLIAQGALLGMTVYLLVEANSATAFACFFLAGGVMVLTNLFPMARKPAVLNFLVAAALIIPLSAMFLGVGSGLVEDLGRNTTFTGRTAIWHAALGMVRNPVFGAGFESFWVGPRLKEMAREIQQGANQAHNGYIETYLNLGWVGLLMLAILLITGYRRIATDTRSQMQAGSLRLAYFIVIVAYNFSEAGFKMMHPVWVIFLLSIAVIPERPVPKTPRVNTKFDGAHPVVDSPVRLHNPRAPRIASRQFAAALKLSIASP